MKSSPITSIFVSVAAALILSTTVNRARGADKVLVGAKPPLTQGMIDLDTAAVELLLDLRFTAAERREYRDVWIKKWKGLATDEKGQAIQALKGWAKLPTWSNYRRNEIRAFMTVRDEMLRLRQNH